MQPSDKNHREIDELLPAYVNGTLGDAERQQVEAHLARHPETQSEVEWLQALRSGMKNLPAGNAPGEMGWQRLRRELSKEVSTHTTARSSMWWKPAMAAAAVIIIVQAALLSGVGPKDERFQPLSGPATQGSVVQIQFQPGATEAQIRAVLKSVDGQLVAGPSALGLYRLQIGSSETSTQALNQALETLRARDDVVAHASID